MKFCQFCGKEILDQAVVCVHCGKELTAMSSSNQTAVKNANSGTTASPFWTLAGIAEIIAVVVYSIHLILDNNDNPFSFSFFVNLIPRLIIIIGLFAYARKPNPVPAVYFLFAGGQSLGISLDQVISSVKRLVDGNNLVFGDFYYPLVRYLLPAVCAVLIAAMFLAKNNKTAKLWFVPILLNVIVFIGCIGEIIINIVAPYSSFGQDELSFILYIVSELMSLFVVAFVCLAIWRQNVKMRKMQGNALAS